MKEQCEKKPRVAQNSTANLCGKQLLKQKKDDSESEEGSKENLHSCESPKRSSYKQSQPCRKGNHHLNTLMFITRNPLFIDKLEL